MSKNQNSAAAKSHSAETSLTSRKLALQQLLAVLKDGQSLSAPSHVEESVDPRDAAFARMISFGVLRFYHQLVGQLKPLMKKPLKAKDLDVQLILLMALYQLQHTRVPDYAVVDAAVKQIRKSRKQWAASMVNAVLRNFIRQQAVEADAKADALQAVDVQTDEAIYAHPQWIIDRLKQDWPDCWQDILQANNQQAPMALRINQQKITTAEYQNQLQQQGIIAETVSYAPAALVLNTACDVRQLPGFDDGWVSVQDAGAQLAAQILQPQLQQRVLDACAAPGGKTAHMFEQQPSIDLTAVDISESRLQRVKENCERLGFNPQLVVADAVATDDWWQGDRFDRILLDVPCSASGVIRRHPDIKHLRRAGDIDKLQQTQREILQKTWQLLKPGGQLLYATCSLFKAENEQQIDWFCKLKSEARVLALPELALQAAEQNQCQAGVGLQLFPTAVKNDGFYYALLQKNSGLA